MTRSEIISALSSAGIENPEFDADVLIEHFTKIPRIKFLADDGDFSNSDLKDAVEKRSARIPLQYIIGEWEFFGLKFEVNSDCLIPRADTEILVDFAIKNLPRNARALDLCTGSGAIAVAAAKQRDDITLCACDISRGALETAKRNAVKNGVQNQIEFIEADVTQESFTREKFDMIISNPPYIKSRDLDALSPEVKCEPKTALDGGGDGLMFYRAIIKNFRANLCGGGCFAFECGYDEKDEMQTLARENGFDFDCIYDYGKNFRVAILKLK